MSPSDWLNLSLTTWSCPITICIKGVTKWASLHWILLPWRRHYLEEILIYSLRYTVHTKGKLLLLCTLFCYLLVFTPQFVFEFDVQEQCCSEVNADHINWTCGTDEACFWLLHYKNRTISCYVFQHPGMCSVASDQSNQWTLPSVPRSHDLNQQIKAFPVKKIAC